MIYGLDASTPPSSVQAANYVAEGYSFFCGYIGGNTPYTWARSDIDRVANAGLKFLAIWVAPFGSPTAAKGTLDGKSAVLAMQSRRLSTTIVLDVENGYIPTAYTKAFVEQLNLAGVRVILYGTSITLRALGTADIVDGVWLCYVPADFIQGVPVAQYDWNIWQFSFGSPCDFNVARDDMFFTDVN